MKLIASKSYNIPLKIVEKLISILIVGGLYIMNMAVRISENCIENT